MAKAPKDRTEVDQPVQFDFSEALKHLRQGKRVRRLGWVALRRYFEMREQDLYEMEPGFGPNRLTKLRWSDILASDWVLVEEDERAEAVDAAK